jgi:mono/diheme cytochrome c family protein/ketosteroid isomerase-like protein
MHEDSGAEPLRIFLDDAEEPFKVEQPPLRFNFNTISLPDGDHQLRIEASNGLAPPTIRRIPFTVRNGVAVTVSGLEPNQTIGGQVELIINAYAGSSEVDFEPRKAETPQPIPTWAWVLFLAVGAWTMFYVLNRPLDVEAGVLEKADQVALGERLYMDTCGRCHGEGGEGQSFASDIGGFSVPSLRENTNYALADTPVALLTKVILGQAGTMMPTWGPLLNTEETIAVVNHVRQSWRHDASTINLDHWRPPKEIELLESSLEKALTSRKGPNADVLAQCCWPEGPASSEPPILYRTDGVIAVGREAIKAAWQSYFDELGPGGRVTKYKLAERRYDYEGATVDQPGSIVIEAGRVFLEAQRKGQEPQQASGRFMRIYERHENGWALVLDFADIPMAVGCEILEPDCPIEGPVPPTPAPDDDPPTPPPAGGDQVGFQQIVDLLAGLDYGAPSAPHGDFWKLPYDEFMAFEFPMEKGVPELAIKLVVPGKPDESNLLLAFEGKEVHVLDKEAGESFPAEIARMPKNKPPLDPKLIATIRAWIEAGCPKEPGGAPYGAAGGKPPPSPAAGTTPPPGPVASAGGSVGFKEVKQLLAGLGYAAPRSPHGHFWDLGYREFVTCAFPLDKGAPELMLKLIELGKPDESNLVLALEGKEVTVTDTSDGSTFPSELARMPKNKPPVDKGLIETIRNWIAAGCPEVAGGAPFTAGGAKQTSPPPVSPIGFDDVIQYLKDLGKKATTVPHGSFWENLGYEEFVAFRFPRNYGDEAEYQLLVPYDAESSNLVKVLRDGKGVVRTDAEGGQIVEDLPRMPKNALPMPSDRLEKIILWIDAGCPERAGEPSKLARPAGAGPDPETPAGIPVPAGPAPDEPGGGDGR